MDPYTILVADDNLEILRLIRIHLERYGCSITTVEDGAAALRMIEREKFDVVLTDILMPIRDGLELISHLRCHAPETFIVAMSGGGRRCAAHYLECAKGLGAQAILPKPFSRSDLISAISEVGAGKRHQNWVPQARSEYSASWPTAIVAADSAGRL